MSTGFVYNQLNRSHSLIYVNKSKKDTSLSDVSELNFIVGCTLFKWVTNLSSSSYPCIHSTYISDMDPFHKTGYL